MLETQKLKDVVVFVLLLFAILFLFRQAFSIFFVQDDFILIDQFSQNRLLVDFGKTFGFPEVTHFRPLHNLYFLISGNFFGKNYQLYHLFSFLIHVLGAYVVFKVGEIIFKNSKSALVGAFFYAVNPLHFVALFWISGTATTIGFFFLITSFYFFLKEKRLGFVILFFLSLLASEAMIVGIALFPLWSYLSKKLKVDFKLIFVMTIVSLMFIIFRFVFLTPGSTFDAYELEVSVKTIPALKYYFLRIIGLSESSDNLTKITLLSFLTVIFLFAFRKIVFEKEVKLLLFFAAVIVIGLFPFVLIPKHLSGHYMNISAFGFAMMGATILSGQNRILILVTCFIFFVTVFLGVNATYNNNWVVKRSDLSRAVVDHINSSQFPSESTLVFVDGIAASKEVYISLGSGKAVDFLFGNKNYKTCFTFFENCQNLENSFWIRR